MFDAVNHYLRGDQGAPGRNSPRPSPRQVKNGKGPASSQRGYRTIFISDTHLGTPGCQAEQLLDFLKSTHSRKLYLVGDIIDGWRLKRSWYWTETQSAVIRRILKIVKHGTEVIFIPGNHDEAFREYAGHDLAGIRLQSDAIHVTAAGRKYWVTHGDEFDGIIKFAKWLAYAGDWAYGGLLYLNTWFNRARRCLGYPYWSLSRHIKHKVKNAVEFISKFEEAVAHEAARRGVDGVICGHIHHAEQRKIGSVHYCNDGDWVESCTALVEHYDGRMEILHWADEIRARSGQKELPLTGARV